MYIVAFLASGSSSILRAHFHVQVKKCNRNSREQKASFLREKNKRLPSNIFNLNSLENCESENLLSAKV